MRSLSSGASSGRVAAENIRDEIADLTAAGVAEIGLVAQDLAAYGRDIGDPGIVDLIRAALHR